MKILVVAENIYDKQLYSNSRSITGLAVMVRDIFDCVSNEHDCYILPTNMECPPVSYGKLHIVENNFKGKLSHFSFRIIISVIILLCKGKVHEIKGFVRKELREKILLKRFEILYDTIKPDIVNLHDLSDINTTIAESCLKRNIKVLMTSHLYIGKSDVSYGYSYLKRNEEKLFSNPDANFYLSFVSMGMKNRFLSDYKNFPKSHVFCIVNGSKLENQNSEPIRRPEIFDKVGDKKVLLCIGTYCKRKNQDQIIAAYNSLDETNKSRLAVMFIGKDDNGILESNIVNSPSNGSLYYCGKVTLSDMRGFYNYCDGTITTSLNESFGLTIIEGFTFGKPAILFSDLDSFEDLYDPNTCVAINDHTDKAVTDAMTEFINKEWDSDYIKKFTGKYSMERVSTEYINTYRTIIDGKM